MILRGVSEQATWSASMFSSVIRLGHLEKAAFVFGYLQSGIRKAGKSDASAPAGARD